jgi:hypothetical protein
MSLDKKILLNDQNALSSLLVEVEQRKIILIVIVCLNDEKL